MEKDLIAYMLTLTGITTLCSSRIYPISRPQGDSLPALVVQRISGSPEYADDGEVGLEFGRIQVRAWGETYGAAKDLIAAVIDNLSAVADVTQGSTTFRQIHVDVIRDDPRTGGNNTSEYLFSSSVDLTIWIGD